MRRFKSKHNLKQKHEQQSGQASQEQAVRDWGSDGDDRVQELQATECRERSLVAQSKEVSKRRGPATKKLRSESGSGGGRFDHGCSNSIISVWAKGETGGRRSGVAAD